jgi:hypothetical protein
MIVYKFLIMTKITNNLNPKDELETIRKSINKNIPFGGNILVGKMVNKFKLEQTLHSVGRPKNGG